MLPTTNYTTCLKLQILASGANTNMTTIFTYLEGESWENYSHPEFVPDFVTAKPDAATTALCGSMNSKF